MELYIHIPFCKKKCDYCDFLSYEAENNIKAQYVKKLIEEIKTCNLCQEEVTTVFFGGGTPSILPAKEITNIMKAINNRFTIQKDAEISLEANPGTVTMEKLLEYRVAGINRLSFGLQSAQNDELKILGRIHTYQDFEEGFQLARKAGFHNINVDLMSALPGQTPETWLKTLKTVLEFRPEHISAYSLIIEENTPFHIKYGQDRMNQEAGGTCRDLPSEEHERDMYYDTKKVLEEKGYIRYEISNYSLPGFACRHNCGYWKRVNYLGFGLGAASLVENVRFHNTKEMERYLNGNFEKEDKDHLTLNTRMEEYIFLGLRMASGISTLDFEKEFKYSFSEVFGTAIDKLKKEKLIEHKEERLALSEKGIDLSNYVLAQFLL